MPLPKTSIFLSIVVFLILLVFFFFPNILNEREQKAFSETDRLQKAEQEYHINKLEDSLVVIPGSFYMRDLLHQWLLGSGYRHLWQQPIKVAVLDLENFRNGSQPVEFSGSQQTIGIEIKDADGKVWSVRSVNKDQSEVLTPFLRYTLLRPMIRDQASALNPYGALVLPILAEAIQIHHTNPRIFFFPFDEKYEKYNARMAGRLVLVEEEVDKSWAGTPEFNNAIKLIDTEDMIELAQTEEIPVDTLLYARSRLFDLLISDWDRHEGNWEWALVKKDGQEVLQPVPVDRDGAFYNFQNGIINQLVLFFNNKFQSFTPEFKGVEGLMVQSKDLDQSILGAIEQDEILKQASFIQEQLTDEIIEKAFRQYPPEIYQLVGRQHEEILKRRKENLLEAATTFHNLLQKRP